MSALSGVDMLRTDRSTSDLHGPYPGLLPSGGIRAGNARSFLDITGRAQAFVAALTH